jgi:hypothetical protein
VNLFSTKLRRSATVLGGTFLGLSLVAAMSSPALACRTELKGWSECSDKGWVAKFEVANDFHTEATVTSVKVDGQESATGVGEIAKGAKVAPSFSRKLTGAVQAPSNKRGVLLAVTLEWQNGRFGSMPNTAHYRVSRPTQQCAPGKPPATATPTTTPTTTPTQAPTEPTVTPPSTPTLPLPTQSGPSKPAPPKQILDVDCDSMTIGLDNTKGGVEFKLHFKPSRGAEKDLDIKPGEKKTATFTAGEGFFVELSISAVFGGRTTLAESVTIPYEAPANCGDEGGDGGEGGLPVTGAAAGGLAGGAALLLAAGGVLLFLVRRRRLKFTA